MNVADTPDLLEEARRGNNEACARLIEENGGLIWSIVRRYYGRGVEPEDLYQLGCLGFLKAVRGFDPAFGCQFSTYAVPKIAGEIRRYLRDDGAIKVSRGLKERGMAIRAARERLSASLGREPTLSQLSEATGLEPEEIAAAEEAGLPVASLQMETGDGLTLESVLGTEGIEEGIVERESLRTAIAALPDRERQVILLRYYRGMTQDRAARVLGVSQVQVSRIERKAVERLRHKLEEGRRADEGIGPYDGGGCNCRGGCPHPPAAYPSVSQKRSSRPSSMPSWSPRQKAASRCMLHTPSRRSSRSSTSPRTSPVWARQNFFQAASLSSLASS